MIKINVKKINEKAKLPTQGSDLSAGYDLMALFQNEDFVAIEPHTAIMIPTGLAFDLPEGYFGAVFARSGLSTKKGLRPSTCVSVIDEDYKGEIFVPLYNDSNETQIINNGDRVSQLVLLPYQKIEFNIVKELGKTKRGENGFGSTGLKEL